MGTNQVSSQKLAQRFLIGSQISIIKNIVKHFLDPLFELSTWIILGGWRGLILSIFYIENGYQSSFISKTGPTIFDWFPDIDHQKHCQTFPGPTFSTEHLDNSRGLAWAHFVHILY